MATAIWGTLVAVLLASCVVLGGGAAAGYFGDVVLQVAAIPVLLMALWRLGPLEGSQRTALLFCGALVLVPLLQLVPLPPALWTRLPWRDVAAQSLILSGQEVGWRPLSLTPHATWLSLASLLPPLAIFCATLQLSARDRRGVVMVLLGVGLLASFVGLLQVALGPSRAIVDFGPTSPGEATGFFANRNHFAAFLYVLLVFAAVFAINSVKSLPASVGTLPDSKSLIGIVASFTLVIVLLGAELMARSRAGIGLTMVALLGIAALANSDARGTTLQRTNARRLFVGAVVLVLIFGAQFALYRIMDRFAADPLSDARLVFARNTWSAALSFMPWGSGLGSFVPVYQFFERPQDSLVDVYANRAHNEVLDVWLETGVFGLVLMTVFAVWLVRSLWRVWRAEETAGVDLLLARAATLILVLLAAHSLVEYPLRTTALMAVSAFACGLLFPPVPEPSRAESAQPARAVRDDERRAGSLAVGPSLKAARPDTAVAAGGPAWPPRTAEAGSEQRQQTTDAWAWPDATKTPVAPSSEQPANQPPAGQRPKERPQDLWSDAMAWPAAWQTAGEDKPPAETDEGRKAGDKDDA